MAILSPDVATDTAPEWLRTRRYALADTNEAVDDLRCGRLVGRPW